MKAFFSKKGLLSTLSVCLFGILYLFLLKDSIFSQKEPNQQKYQGQLKGGTNIVRKLYMLPVKGNTGIKTPQLHHGDGKYNLTHRKGLKSPLTLSWSQYDQDRLVDELLNGKKNGFFVEVGAYDGETYSNTLFLERYRNWTGLLIEPNSIAFRDLVHKRRKCYAINACLCSSISNNVTMLFYSNGAMTALLENTHQTAGVSDAKITRKDGVIEKKDSVNFLNKSKNGVGSTFKTFCHSLTSLLKQTGATHIDYFSLDVEGAELDVLSSINWNLTNIDVFTIETTRNRREILNFMNKHGYKWLRLQGVDDVFRKHHDKSYTSPVVSCFNLTR